MGTFSYWFLWLLKSNGMIENNFFDNLFIAANQWIRAIRNIDILGIPLRFIESIVQFYLGVNSFNPDDFN